MADAAAGQREDVDEAREAARLVALARARDYRAFEELVRRYRSAVYALALRMLRNPGDAEELTQETFLSAWQNLPGFRGDASFGSWLHRICANFALMRLRRKKLEPELTEDAVLPEPRFDGNGTLLSVPSYEWARGTEEKVLDRELAQAIEEATEKLTDDYRVVFLLRDYDGFSYEDIASTLGMTVPAVKSRLHRARLALRESIADFYGKKPKRLGGGRI